MSTQLELFPDSPFTLRLQFGEALSLFWEHHWTFLAKSKTTKKCFKRLAQFFGKRFVDEISKSDIESLRRHLSTLGLKGNTINTHHVIVTRLYNKLSEWKEARTIDGMDFSRITLPVKNPGTLVPKINESQFRRKIAWPKRLVQRLIIGAAAMNDLDLAETIEMLYLTRLRPGDLFRVTEKNVDLVRMILSGVQHKTITSRMPSGIPYLIAITETMAKILKRRAAFTEEGKPLFKNVNLRKRFDCLRRIMNLKHVQLRDFRPSSATLLLDNGIDPETVAESLGHTTLRMLPTYTPRTMVHQRRAQMVLENEKTEILT